jgi:hypothetical protein
LRISFSCSSRFTSRPLIRSGAGSAGPARDFHGERRSNATHTSTTDPEARLYRKGRGKEVRLSFMGHALMKNRHGLIVDGRVSEANGTASATRRKR